MLVDEYQANSGSFRDFRYFRRADSTSEYAFLMPVGPPLIDYKLSSDYSILFLT